MLARRLAGAAAARYDAPLPADFPAVFVRELQALTDASVAESAEKKWL
jgi:hypothetical protein